MPNLEEGEIYLVGSPLSNNIYFVGHTHRHTEILEASVIGDAKFVAHDRLFETSSSPIVAKDSAVDRIQAVDACKEEWRKGI